MDGWHCTRAELDLFEVRPLFFVLTSLVELELTSFLLLRFVRPTRIQQKLADDGYVL